MLSVIQRISRGCTSVHMCEFLRTKWKYFKISYESEKYIIVPFLYNNIIDHEIINIYDT